jgi:hypothetical protein
MALSPFLAMTIHTVSRMALSNLCTWLGRQIALKCVRPIVIVSYTTQDETPMVANHRKTGPRMFSNLSPATTKILQSEVDYGFLVFDENSERYKFLVAELPTNLQATDSTRGANVRACLEGQVQVQLFFPPCHPSSRFTSR